MASASYNPSLQGTSFAFPSQFPSAQSEISQYSAVQIATLQAKLNQKLGPEFLSSRPGPGGGPKLTYAEGWKVINLANEVFGFNGWCSSITNLTVDFIDTHGENPPRYNVGVHCIARVTLRDGAFHEDVGYGFMDNAKQKGAALDKCKKEAVTDALKRTLRSFGNLLGNCLYDKSYVEQVTKIKVPPPRKLDSNDLHRRPEFDPKYSNNDARPSTVISGGNSDFKPVPDTTLPANPVQNGHAQGPDTSAFHLSAVSRPLIHATIVEQDREKVSRTVVSPDGTTDIFGSEDDSFLANIDLGVAIDAPQQPKAPPPRPPQQNAPSVQQPQQQLQTCYVQQQPLRPQQQHNPPFNQPAGKPPFVPRSVPARPSIGSTSSSTLQGDLEPPEIVKRAEAQAAPASRVVQPHQDERKSNHRVSFGAVTASHHVTNGTTIGPAGGRSAQPESMVNGSAPRFDSSNGRAATHSGHHSSPRHYSDSSTNGNPPIRGFVAGTVFGRDQRRPPGPVEREERVLVAQPQQGPQHQQNPPQQLGGFLHAGMKRRAETMAGYGGMTERKVLGDLELDENGNPKRMRR